MKNITDKSEAWAAKFELLIQILKDLIYQEGKEMIFLNVEAENTPKEQFTKYMQTVEFARDKVEYVVSTSLPGEERMYWPFYEVQFYIRDDNEKIIITGNPEIIQRISSFGFQVQDK